MTEKTNYVFDVIEQMIEKKYPSGFYNERMMEYLEKFKKMYFEEEQRRIVHEKDFSLMPFERKLELLFWYASEDHVKQYGTQDREAVIERVIEEMTRNFPHKDVYDWNKMIHTCDFTKH